jgi:hypothetical protein
MVNPYAWAGTAQEMSGAATTLADREVPADVASVARMWVGAAYDDLRRAGPDRAFEVRRILDGYVIPWFGPQTTTVGDISYFMVHEWLLNLVGRGRGDLEDGPAIRATLRVAGTDAELSLSQAAEMAESQPSDGAATLARRRASRRLSRPLRACPGTGADGRHAAQSEA